MLVVGGAFGGDGAASGVIPFGGSRAHFPPQMLVVGGASGGSGAASGMVPFGGSRAHLPWPWYSLVVGGAFSGGTAHLPPQLFGGPAHLIGQSLCEVR
jgi:hypothetical protein